jgi:hypothetical protein
MTNYPISAGIQLSLDNSTWYKITDHNRQPLEYNPELIESSSRMANGKMRKYVIAKKEKISTSWDYVPSKTSECVDGNHGPAWLESFYKANVGIPLYLKVITSGITVDPATGSVPDNFYFQSALNGSKVYSVFITNFSKTINNRTKLSDYVDMNIEFTEI